MSTQNITSVFAICAFIGAAPAFAQSEGAAEAAAEAVAEAVAQAAEDAVETVEIEAVEDGTVHLPSARIASPSVAQRPRNPRNPRPKNYQFIRPADYPIAAWQEDETGIIHYSVEVSAEGKPKSCKIVKGAELARLAAATCPLVMERAEYRPARNKEGADIAGTYEGRYNWRKREPEMPQMTLVFQYLHDEKGNSSDCKFLKMENLPEKMRMDIERDKERGRSCSGGPAAGQKGTPYRDENGVPIAKRVTVTFDVVLEEAPVSPAE
ncbi:MAG: energy transducer TonB [Erythrobacter sp.]